MKNKILETVLNFVFIVAMILGFFGCSSNAKTSNSGQINLIITSSMMGYIEPCG